MPTPTPIPTNNNAMEIREYSKVDVVFGMLLLGAGVIPTITVSTWFQQTLSAFAPIRIYHSEYNTGVLCENTAVLRHRRKWSLHNVFSFGYLTDAAQFPGYPTFMTYERQVCARLNLVGAVRIRRTLNPQLVCPRPQTSCTAFSHSNDDLTAPTRAASTSTAGPSPEQPSSTCLAPWPPSASPTPSSRAMTLTLIQPVPVHFAEDPSSPHLIRSSSNYRIPPRCPKILCLRKAKPHRCNLLQQISGARCQRKRGRRCCVVRMRRGWRWRCWSLFRRTPTIAGKWCRPWANALVCLDDLHELQVRKAHDHMDALCGAVSIENAWLWTHVKPAL
ncbi:hypothetical protein Hypma_005628 [Hypsizygus marmoreus]|uniref:Uncharacterized protein n=1 Tax=Hypsizygus marmoreus TaxID=39966 RepID=A0A369JVX1_HYPMA|nr:hypothetical protein Hypma_005628 [Hypsizygus marmoreus]